MNLKQFILLAFLLLVFLYAFPTHAQEDFPPQIEICGNDETFHLSHELAVARKALQSHQEAEVAELMKDADRIDWPRIVELRKQHFKQWQEWFDKNKVAHPKWPFLDDEVERSVERIKYKTNTDFLYAHESSLLQKEPTLISSTATASAWNVWPNQPFRLDPDPTQPGENVVPRGGSEKSEHVYVHLAKASIIDRIEFELAGAKGTDVTDEKESLWITTGFHTDGIFTRWEKGKFVARVPSHIRPDHPYEVAIHHRPGKPAFTAKNIRIYGWTMDDFPFEVARPEAVTPDQAKAKAAITCKSENWSGKAKAVAFKYLLREHLQKGMKRAEIEAILGDRPDDQDSVVYHARAGGNAMDKKVYATLTVGYKDDVVESLKLSCHLHGEVIALGNGTVGISIGEDDGLKVDDELIVYREKERSRKQISRIVVTKVMPDKSVCRRMDFFHKQVIIVGDAVIQIEEKKE